jgi:hypothetical protein
VVTCLVARGEQAVKDQYFQNYLNDPRRILPSMPEAMLSARPEVTLPPPPSGFRVWEREPCSS